MKDRSITVIEKLVRSIKRRKAYYTAFLSMAAIVVFCTVYALILPAITLTPTPMAATPRTSSALSYKMYSNTDKTRRAYIEYALPNTNRSVTFGILRQSVIYVYAYAGETICLGSDVTESRINANDVVEKKATGVDILLIGPDGTKYTFDNDAETGLGFINTTTQEQSGANFEGSNNTAGYKPHEFKVRLTGLYEVRFHSYNGDAFGCNKDGYPHLRQTSTQNASGVVEGSSGQPVAISLKSETWCNSGNSVGAFDATVINNGEVQSGRAYADYLAINMGNNAGKSATIYGDYYIVTSDGYIYKSDFELDPFGFLFFANSRGVVDTETGYSSYHSVRGKDQDSDAQIIMTDIPYTVYTPQHEATELDKTYMIFFEEPDIALQGILYQRAFAPGMATNIEFIGSKEGNITYVGNGGYFKFDVENAVSATISISFETYNEMHGTHYEDVEINANVTKGTNYVYWDGNDKNGEVIPVGWYRNGNIEIEVRTHAGEIHFPFLDVENGFDLRFERINNIYNYNNGILTDVTDSYEDSKYLVYYNNTIMPDKRNCPTQSIIADGLDCSSGIDSSVPNVMKYTGSNGDYTILDVWTYAIAKSDMEIRTDLIVEDLDGYYTVNLNGLVFFDKDNSSAYNLTGGDFVLSDVEVSLDYYYCGTRWNIEKDPEDDSVVICLRPAGHIYVDEEDGSEHIDYYYHNYEIVLNEDDGQYYLYKYEYGDYLHEQEPVQAYDNEGNPITVSIDIHEEYVEEEDETITKYLVWIPVHKETTTDALGKYYFTGILINEEMYEVPAENPEFGDMVISVHNPNPDLYLLTTADAHTGDFDYLNGTDYDEGSQTILLTDIEDKITVKRETDPDARNFLFSTADVGYYYETYEPPLTLIKHWGTIEDSNNIEKITLLLQGYAVRNGEVEIYEEREVTLSYYSWYETLVALPAAATVNGERIPLSYRVVSESFVRFERDTFYLYKYTYHWDAEEPYGEYMRVETDANGVPLEGEVLSPLAPGEEPFETFISEVEHQNVGDRIYVENWQSETTLITITKYGAEDNVTKLPYATFKLQKLVHNPETDVEDFVDVRTDLGVYTVTTDQAGTAVFRGLTEGVYRIVETVAPEFFDLAEPIVFTVSKTETTENGNVLGTYEETYTVDIYDQLLENPVSIMKKFDQYGDPISDAEFTFYRADENYNYDPENDLLYIDAEKTIPAVVKMGENGTATLMKQLPNGEYRSLYISEILAMLDGSDRFVMVETHIPEGYRGLSEAHMRITGRGLSSYIICDNPYESGVWAEPLVTVYAPETLQVVDMSQLPNISSASYVDAQTGEIDFTEYTDNGRITSKGTLFGIIVKRNGAEPDQGDMTQLTFESWSPVYGDAIGGYHTLSDPSKTTLEKAIDVIKLGGAYEFTSNSNGTLLYTKIEDLPGNPDRYYTYMMSNHMDSIWRGDEETGYYSDPQFAVLYYYSTASSLRDVTAENTARVTSHGLYNQAEKFTLHFATNILIPDVVNALYVQKSNLEDHLVDNAVFGMYDAVSERSGKGYYIGTDAQGNTVYITLSEDEDMTAEVFTGTIDDDGFLIPSQTKLCSGTYSFDTVGYSQISSITPEELKRSEGRVSALSFVSDTTGTITVVTDDDTVYTVTPAKNAENNTLVDFTHGACEAIVENGTAHFRFLKKGKYFVREIYAPDGYDLNYTNIEAYVGDEEVYANAGDIDDNVMVGNGAGYVISTLHQFASIGDIKETLSYIVTALRLAPDDSSKDGFVDLADHMEWPYMSLDPENTRRYIFDGTEDKSINIRLATVIYLMYNGSANENIDEEAKTLFDYMVNPDGPTDKENNLIDSLIFWTKSNWSDLAIFQHYTAAERADAENPEITYTDISLKNGVPNDISLLFSSSTFIRVADDTRIGMQVRKISSANGARLKDAGFVFYRTDEDNVNHYYTVNNKGKVVWKTLGENESELTFCIMTNEIGQISYEKLDDGVYTLKEVAAPMGYLPPAHTIQVTVTDGAIAAVKDDGSAVPVYPPTEVSPNGVWEYVVVVTNDVGYEMPATGGSGTLMYTVGGLLFMTAAAVVYGYKTIHKRKRERGKG